MSLNYGLFSPLMILTPSSLILSMLLGFFALALADASLFLAWRVMQTRTVVGRGSDDSPATIIPILENCGRRIVLLTIAAGLLMWVFDGRYPVMQLRHSEPDQQQYQFTSEARRIAGASGAELAVEESEPVGAAHCG